MSAGSLSGGAVTGGGGVMVMPGSGTLISQTSATITTASQALVGVPGTAMFAQIQLHGGGISARYDGTAASFSAVEEQYAAGGMIRLTTAGDIAGFRYIGTVAAAFSIMYRTA